MMAFSAVRKELDCSICLNIYTDPVMLKCGHNFCRDCIDRVLDIQEESGDYSCPECREESQERPDFNRNITLCNISKQFHYTKSEHKDGQIFCTYCIHTPVPAVKSCLQCEASLCDNHLRAHSRFSQHILSNLTTSLENKKCSVHKKDLKYYCTEDSALLCESCKLLGEHQEHQVEDLDVASRKKKENLANDLQNLMEKMKGIDQSMKSLQEHKGKVKESSVGVTQSVTTLFRDIRRQLDTLERRVLNEISKQIQKDSLLASDLIQDLEIKKDELLWTINHIEKICNMTDPLTVLQVSDTGDVGNTEDGNKEKCDQLLCEGADLDVSAIPYTLYTGLSNIVNEVYSAKYMLEPAYILLDVDTAHRSLFISDGRKIAVKLEKELKYPDTPQRFSLEASHVLSSKSFSSGRHYWDVDVGGSSYWGVGLCYPNINRARKQSGFGNDLLSWGLERNTNTLSAKHGTTLTTLSSNASVRRVRVYLDYEAGQISFYDLAFPIRHLHTFTDKFHKPLHAVIYVGQGKIKIVKGDKTN